MGAISGNTGDKLHTIRPIQRFVTTGHHQGFTYNRLPTFSQEASLPYLRGLFMTHLLATSSAILRTKHDTALDQGILMQSSAPAA